MTRYLVERYLPVAAARSLAGDDARLNASPDVRLVMTFYASEDETCFHLLDARSAAAVRRVSASSGLRIDRIVAVETVREHEAVAR